MKKSSFIKISSRVFLVACLVCALTLNACSSGEPATSDDTVPEDPKYTVQIFVDCMQNLIFSKYDVDVIVDGEEIGNVEHGSEATFEVSLTKGQHELVFEKEGYSDPDGKTSFVVEGEGDKFSYRINCTSDQIEIKSIEDEKDIEPDEEINSEEQELKENDTAKQKETPKNEELAEKEEEPVETVSEEEPEPSKYEYAYVRRMSNYDLYYLIDFDEMTATYFGTNDSGSMVMPCTGDLNNGLTIDYVEDEFQEHLQFKTPGNDSVVVLTDGNGFEWDFTKADVAEAEAVLSSVS